MNPSNLSKIRRKMKIIAFGDIHEDLGNLRLLKNELENADIVIVTGDLTNYNGKKRREK